MKFNFHGITGCLAILFMFGHAIWTNMALWLKQEKVLTNFHKFSPVVWVLWLIPFISGLVGTMFL